MPFGFGIGVCMYIWNLKFKKKEKRKKEEAKHSIFLIDRDSSQYVAFSLLDSTSLVTASLSFFFFGQLLQPSIYERTQIEFIKHKTPKLDQGMEKKGNTYILNYLHIDFRDLNNLIIQITSHYNK
jgi:hypothetical protein